MKREALAYGLDEEPSEEDARELFEALQEEFATGEGIDEDEEDLDQQGTSQTFHAENPDSISYTHSDLAPIDENNSAEKESRLALLNDHIELSRLKPDDIAKIRDLQRALPGLPISRLRKVTKAFESTLGYPSILTLVPILRESLPDHLTSGRLKRMNTSNANFVLQKAEEYRVVDISLLNSMLQVKTSASSLDDAESFHRDEFRRHNLVSPKII